MTTPRVVILTAMRDVAWFVEPWVKMISLFTYRPSRVFVMENDCKEDHIGILERLQWSAYSSEESPLTSKQASVLHAWQSNTGAPLYPREATARRSAHLALVRNKVIEQALTFSDWTHALMLDAQKWTPPDTIERLLAWDVDIVGTVNTFYQGGPHRDTWCVHSLTGGVIGHDLHAQKPTGIREKDLAAVGTVGGVYLVRREVFEAGCRLAGTNGRGCDSVPLCEDARAKGFGVWLDKTVETVHCETPDAMKRLVG